MPNHAVMFSLECGHVMPALKYGNGTVLCYECQLERPIVDVHTHEWHSVCVKGCKHSVWTGSSKHLADRDARNHYYSNTNHTVKVVYEENRKAVHYRDELVRNGLIIGVVSQQPKRGSAFMRPR